MVYFRHMLAKQFPVAVVVFLALIAAACGGGKASVPSSSGLTGDWHGSTQDNLFGSGQLSFKVTQNSSNVTGKWSMTFPNPQNNDAGDVSGSTSGASVQMTFAPASPQPCTTYVTGSLSPGGDRMSGTYDNGNCPIQESGTFTASK